MISGGAYMCSSTLHSFLISDSVLILRIHSYTYQILRASQRGQLSGAADQKAVCVRVVYAVAVFARAACARVVCVRVVCAGAV